MCHFFPSVLPGLNQEGQVVFLQRLAEKKWFVGLYAWSLVWGKATEKW